MSDPGAPRPRGRHSSPDADNGGVPAPWTLPVPPTHGGHSGAGRRSSDPLDAGARRGAAEPAGWEADTVAWAPVRPGPRADVLAGAPTAGIRRASGAFQRSGDHDDSPDLQWRHRGAGPGDDRSRPPADDLPTSSWGGAGDDRPVHPSAPLPPRPPGTWERLASTGRPGDGPMPGDDAPTEAQPLWDDRTGGLEVLGGHVDDQRGEHDDDGYDEYHDDEYHDDYFDGEDDGPDRPAEGRRRSGRRGRRPVAVVLALAVFAGLVLGIIFGGQKLIGLVHPSSKDYVGQGTGTVQVRVASGDTLSDIARTLQEADVIAGVGPFVDAAETNPAAMRITAGVYRLRSHMSGQAALDLMLQPSARLVTRVTLREGLTQVAVLQKIAEETGVPLDQLQAAAADPAALGLPAYANGSLEGFLFPATYDWEPGTTPVQMLHDMVARTVQALDQLGIPEDQRLGVLTEASIVQAEAGSTDDMGKVARVLDNRIATGMNLQLDTTVNYANGKSGLTTTAQDRANASPYNTYLHPGLPPGPIGNPGEDAIKAVQNPTPGDWLFFVVVDPDTGDTRFAVTADEHAQNVLLFQQWLQAHPGG